MVNYFDLMGLPIDFRVDKNQLDTTFRQLQTQYHPDVQQANTTLQKPILLASLNNEQASAVINTAYQTLKNPDSRATHLLELAGHATGLDESIRDLDFLDKAMDLRISLDAAQKGELSELEAELQHWLAQVEADFYQAYRSQNWQECITTTQQLKFLIKLQNDFAKKTDELAKEMQNDNDLYV